MNGTSHRTTHLKGAHGLGEHIVTGRSGQHIVPCIVRDSISHGADGCHWQCAFEARAPETRKPQAEPSKPEARTRAQELRTEMCIRDAGRLCKAASICHPQARAQLHDVLEGARCHGWQSTGTLDPPRPQLDAASARWRLNADGARVRLPARFHALPGSESRWHRRGQERTREDKLLEFGIRRGARVR